MKNILEKITSFLGFHSSNKTSVSKRIIYSSDLFSTFLYVYGTGLLQPQFFIDHQKLRMLNSEKIFELCYVATVYGFAIGNPKHPLQQKAIFNLQQDPNAAEDFKQLAAFMMVNYKGDVIDDMVKNLQCTRTGAIMRGVTNWLLLELIGDHQPWEVIQMTNRIGKFLCALTFDDLIEKQMKPLIDMRKEGISLSDIREYFAAKQTIEFSKYQS